MESVIFREIFELNLKQFKNFPIQNLKPVFKKNQQNLNLEKDNCKKEKLLKILRFKALLIIFKTAVKNLWTLQL